MYKEFSHVRLNWKKKEWDNMSTLQVRTIRNGEKCTISFHQEKLTDGDQREEVKKYWNEVMKKIEMDLNS